MDKSILKAEMTAISGKKSGEIWAIDSETDPFKSGRVPKPFVWGAYNGEEYHRFDTSAQMLAMLTTRDCLAYAHNGGKFDYHFLLDFLADGAELMVISGRISKFKIGLCEFRDSINIMPFALDNYKKDDIDYDIFESDQRGKPHNKKLIDAYLKADCVYLHELITQYRSDYGSALTQAGAAIKIWGDMSGIKTPSTTKKFYDKMQKYYYGGRVECFEKSIIEDDFAVVDINSAYPAVMCFDHPYGSKFDISDEIPTDIKKAQISFITLTCATRGALPHRNKKGVTTYYNDSAIREYHITGWEYLAGVDTDTISDITIKKVYTAVETINFKPYVDKFFKIKTEAKLNDDKAAFLFSKIFLNALYGKYATNPEKYKNYAVCEPYNVNKYAKMGYESGNNLGKWALLEKELDESDKKYLNICVAASITGAVRAKLWRAMCVCNGVMYCDTDSIAAREYHNLDINATKLGAWDVEAKCDYAAIAGKKMYAFKIAKSDRYKIASKGVRFDAKQIIRVAGGETVLYVPDAPNFSVKRGVEFVERKIKMT